MNIYEFIRDYWENNTYNNYNNNCSGQEIQDSQPSTQKSNSNSPMDTSSPSIEQRIEKLQTVIAEKDHILQGLAQQISQVQAKLENVQEENKNNLYNANLITEQFQLQMSKFQTQLKKQQDDFDAQLKKQQNDFQTQLQHAQAKGFSASNAPSINNTNNFNNCNNFQDVQTNQNNQTVSVSEAERTLFEKGREEFIKIFTTRSQISDVVSNFNKYFSQQYLLKDDFDTNSTSHAAEELLKKFKELKEQGLLKAATERLIFTLASCSFEPDSNRNSWLEKFGTEVVKISRLTKNQLNKGVNWDELKKVSSKYGWAQYNLINYSSEET